MPRKRSGRAGARFALILRLLGATGLFVALLGLIPLATAIDLTSYERLGHERAAIRRRVAAPDIRPAATATSAWP